MASLNIPKAFEPLFKPKRYKVLSGGRGSSKSESVARWLLACCIQGHERILCTRELQNSIKDSVIKTLSDIIDTEKLKGFEVYNTSIRYPRTRSEFIFSGLHGNVNEIKSMKGITKCWCFVAGTKIDDKNIEDIKIGDYVRSFNHNTQNVEYKKVLRVMKRKPPEIIHKLLTTDGTQGILGTSEHPIFVKDKGYLPLCQVSKGDIVYAEIKPAFRSSLFGWLWGDDSDNKRSPIFICKKWWDILSGLCGKKELRENEGQQSNGQPIDKRKNEKIIASHGPQAHSSWWQWSRIYQATDSVIKKTWAWLVGGVAYTYWILQGRKWIPNKLQSGHCEYLSRDSDRNRRWWTSWFYRESRGQEKRRVLTEQRVESIEVQESICLRQLGLSDGGNYVYNLEVEDNNNYFANGLLVHNCEEAHSITKDSLDILIPTIREEGSEIIFTFNRMLQEDPVWLMFCKDYDPEKSTDVWYIHTTYEDNPFFPAVLEQERLKCLANSNADYNHIWKGMPKTVAGNIWNTSWFRWEPVEIPEREFEYRFITADTAYKEKELVKNDKLTDPDYQAFGYWGVLKKKLYLLDVIFKQLKAVEVESWCLPWILPKVVSWGFRYVWVEDKGHGIYLNQLFPKLKIPIPPSDQLKEWMKTRRLDKVARAQNSAARIDINNSNVIINTNMGLDKISRIKEQLALFPNMAHDDLEDLVTDGIYLGLDKPDYVAEYKQLLGRV